jgi:hypothetical protein
MVMHQRTQSRFGSPTPPDRWHRWPEKPRATSRQAQIEVDLGDGMVWAGVRFSWDRSSFVDEETGARVSVTMWQYVRGLND